MTYRIPLIATALVATAAAVAVAQNPPQTTTPPAMSSMAPPAQARESGVDRLLQGITLSPAQRSRVDSIRARHMAEMPAMTAGTTPDSAARAQWRMHSEAMQRDIRAVLTTEQQTVWDRNVAAARAAAPARP